MKEVSVFIGILFCLIQIGHAQVTFIIDEFPEDTNIIYISGDFEGWTGGQESYKLTKEENNFVISLPKQIGAIDFKFTQGSWETVETAAEGSAIGNRTYIFDKKHDTIHVKIFSWDQNIVIQNPTITDNVFVLSNDFEIPQLERTRRIWIYLPPNYDVSNELLPVLYMHDGQNIFDSNSSYSGEWGVDETLNKLYKEKGFKLIVVGIDNGQSLRLDEYSPWENEKYGGGEGDAYLEFIVETLKPYIDLHYNTLADKENTAIMGSSMGGLISYYAGLKYPEVFGKTGVYSAAFWFAPEIQEYAKLHGNIQDSKMYFLAGGQEGVNNIDFSEISKTVKTMNEIVSIQVEQGFPKENTFVKVVPEGKHNEKLWSENFEEAILWLFNK